MKRSITTTLGRIIRYKNCNILLYIPLLFLLFEYFFLFFLKSPALPCAFSSNHSPFCVFFIVRNRQIGCKDFFQSRCQKTKDFFGTPGIFNRLLNPRRDFLPKPTSVFFLFPISFLSHLVGKMNIFLFCKGMPLVQLKGEL